MKANLRLGYWILFTGLIVFILTIGTSRPALTAGSWYVAPAGDDSNSCSDKTEPCATINGALSKASSGDTVHVATGVYTNTASEVVLLDKNAHLSGGWDIAFSTQADKSTIDGEDSHRGITVNSGVTVIIDHFTVNNGSIVDGGGIFNNGTLTLNNSTIDGNIAYDEGGGIFIQSGATLIMNNSTMNNNQANSGGGIFSAWGTLFLNNSTISGNTGSGGGGINNLGGNVSIHNSTISNNSVNSMGGGGIRNEGGGTVTLENSIVAGNIGEFGPDCNNEIGSSGYNLIGNTSNCTFIPTTGDLTDIDARLLPFTGSPGYHPLSRFSPAVDAGNPNGCKDHLGNLLVTDQRGVARVGRCDIGSYEYDPASDPFNYIFLAYIANNYCPDFFDGFNNPASGWFVWEDEYAQWEYLDGEYRILTKDDSYGFYYAHAPTCARENYTVEVDARWVGDPGSHYGIFWDSNRNINDQFYMFGVNTDYQDYYLDHYDGVDWHTIIPWTVSPYINGGIASNHLKITRNGFQITLEVNGIVLVTLTDANLTGRTYTGIFSGSYSGYPTSDARFDNFSITQVNSVEQSSGIHSSSMTADISPSNYKRTHHRQNFMISSKQSIR